MSKDIAIFFWFIVLFLSLTIIKIVFFEEDFVEPVVIEETEENVIIDEPNQKNEKAKVIMKNVYKNFEKRVEEDVSQATKVFNESVKSLK